MLSNVKNTVLRIASEFAALKISQSIGLAGMFSLSGNAAASGGGSASSLLNMASLGSSAMGLLKSGFGATSLLSSVGGMLPGSAGAFFSGMGGGTIAGVSSPAALAGASFGSIAGPAAALFAAQMLTNMFAGNKTISNNPIWKTVSSIPIIGILPGIINGLFGRGPLKQKETQLTGDVGAEGLLSGYLTTNFKAKGGLLVGSKRDFAGVNLLTGAAETDNRKLQGVADSMLPYASQLTNTLKDSVAAIVSQVKDVSGALNISLDPLKDFHHQINLISESGKALTDEQINQEIANISDEMVHALMPSIDSFRKSSETATQTFSRLGQEFKVLEQAAISTGRSLNEANVAILGMQIAARTTLIDQLGGVDAASQKIGFFMDNFLSDTEKTRILFEQLDPEMKKLGFSASLTRSEFVKLVQSVGQAGGITTEQYAGLLNLAGSFDQLDKIRTQLTGTTGTLVDHERSLLDIRNELTSTYQKERGALQNNISAFSQLATNIKSARDGLLLGDLSPLTPQQRLEEARNQFNQVRAQAGSGDQNALAQLPQVAQNFLKASQVYNASGAAYQSDFGLVQNVLQNAEKSALSQVDLLQSQLTKLDDSVSNLIDIKDGTKTTNDLLKEIKAAVLSGSGNPGITTDQIRSYLSANPGLTPDQVASAAAQYGVSGSQLSAAGYNIAPVNQSLGGASVTDQQIRDFVSAHTDDPMAIYKAAVANGISSARLAQVTGISIADIEAFVRKNNLPSFAVGTDFVSRTGLAMVHRAEAIVPSSAIDEIKKLREEVTKLREEQNRQTGDMIKVIDITNRQNAEIIAKSNRETSKDQQWSDRSKTKLA